MLNRVTDCKKTNEKRKSQKFNQKYFFENLFRKIYTKKVNWQPRFLQKNLETKTSGCSPQPYPPKRSLEHTHTHTLKAQPIHPTCPPLFLQDNKTSPSRKPHALSPCPHTHTHSHTPPPNDIKRRTRQILAHLIFNIS